MITHYEVCQERLAHQRQLIPAVEAHQHKLGRWPEFQVELCKKCHATGIAFSWDENGVVAQARDVGEPYTKFYLGAYSIPNMHVHVSLTSAMQEQDKKPDHERTEQRRQEADFALTNAHAVMLMVIRSQNNLFSLDLEKDIEACEKDWAIVWGPPSA
ncbi:MAG: hypothetical protein ACRD7E_27365 [Bryobacteraceae bacterium]